MKYLMWLLKAAIFFVLFAFALNNQGSVTLHLFFGANWQAPLVLVILIALIVGVFLGVAVMVPLWLRAKKLRRHATRTDNTHGFGNETTVMPDEPINPRHGL